MGARRSYFFQDIRYTARILFHYLGFCRKSGQISDLQPKTTDEYPKSYIEPMPGIRSPAKIQYPA